MSSRTRNAEKRRERELQAEQDEIENNRLANRSWYEKIEECDSIYDIKAVLHEMLDLIETKEDKL